MRHKQTFYFRSLYFRFLSLSLPLSLFFPLSFLLKEDPAQGAALYFLDENKAIEAPIAKEGLTRITVKNDRILNVFGVMNEYGLEADEDQGQVFIHPRDGHDSPIHLTLTTEHGITQDLRLLPQNKSPEALIFSSPNVKENKAQQAIKNEIVREKYGMSSSYQGFSHEDASSEPLTRDEIELLLQACYEGRIPLGYKEASLAVSLPVPFPLSTRQGSYLLIRELRGERLHGLTYEVHNHSQQQMVLSEPTFAEICAAMNTGINAGEANHEKMETEKMEIIAILMPQKTVNPGERSFVHVVAKQ